MEGPAACHPRCDGNTKVTCQLDTPIREAYGPRTCLEDCAARSLHCVLSSVVDGLARCARRL